MHARRQRAQRDGWQIEYPRLLLHCGGCGFLCLASKSSRHEAPGRERRAMPHNAAPIVL